MSEAAADKLNDKKSGQNSGSLEFSVLNLELSMHQGESVEGSFVVCVQEQGLAEGTVFSSDIHMECLTGEFTGREEEIFYRFSSEGLEEGEVLEGKFSIISNYGEYELPYRITIKSSVIESGMGSIRNMFHFANLAKANWEEAVKIFYSPEFKNIFKSGADRQYYSAYKGLSAVYGNEQNMEEFLLEINKKQQVEFTAGQTEILVEDPAGVTGHSLDIIKNGWGYVHLNIEAEGEFLQIEKQQVTDDAFLGNVYHLNFHVDSDRLHAGRNYGCIRIYNSHMELIVPVTAVCNAEQRRSYGIRREKKRLLVQLMEYYLAFRGKRISTRTWMGETEKLVERLSALDAKDIQTRLFQAQLLITQERFNEAKWQMERLEDEVTKESSPEIWCYYLYLTTLYSEDDRYVDAVAERVERIYLAHRDSWRIAWLMMHLREEYTKSPTRRFLLLEEQFKKGCVSPVLYVEAWHLLELNPTLLRRLNPFEIQVLHFAAKKELLTQDIIVQIRYQAQKLKEYSSQVFYILKECYEKFPNNETLQSICSLLIKGNKTGKECFEWYSMGVEQELRITRLYEYYMMSMPEDFSGEIPRIVLLYFAYQSELDYRKNAFLYSYVYKNREEHPEYYIKFCAQIENFVLAQIQKGRINKELAYLYKNTLTSDLINKERAEKLIPLLFAHRISTENKQISRVVVCYAVSREEYCYPVSGGRAYVPLYGDAYKILLEDKEGNRYTVSVPYQAEKMMIPDRLLPVLDSYVPEHPGLDIYTYENQQSVMELSGENVSRFRHIAAASYLEQDSRNEVCLKLLNYYYEQDYMHELEAYLKELEPEHMDSRMRNEVIRFMVVRGMYDKAYQWLKRFGIQRTDNKVLVRLCSRLISRDGFLEDKTMARMVYHAFCQGKYDGNLISYLVHFYQGLIGELRDIWKAAEAFETDTYPLCERMLIQMMFTGADISEKMEVFRRYVSGGARMEVESAFLSRCCYDYFVKEKPMDSFIFTDVLRVYQRGEEPDRVCLLACLKYYAKKKDEITPKIRICVQNFLNDMLDEDIYFAFFREYMREFPMLERFMDKTVIEYKSRPGSRVVIHYIVLQDGHAEGEYRQEEMRDMYGGIYVKSFILFFGEKLKYYITEEKDGKEELTVNSSVSRSDIMHEEGDSRFGLINDIMTGQTLQDYDTVDNLLEEYFKKEYIVSEIFRRQ